jgi:YgiT-type zinc finger domain-containing protein
MRSTFRIMTQEICEFCDGSVQDAVTRVPFHYQQNIIYVDNVPVRRCGKCGEIYIEAAVYKQLEKIAEGRQLIKRKITFPLADYRKALALETR